MRIGELSRRSGVPVPTIKYYVREGLLPAGDRTKANQVEYGGAHLRRLGLVRALLEVGGLPVRTAQRVIAQLEAPGTAPLTAMGKAQYALLATDPDLTAEASAALVSGPGTSGASVASRTASASGAAGVSVAGTSGEEGWLAAQPQVDEVIARLGWVVGPNNPARRALAEALAAVRRLGLELPAGQLDGYARAAAVIAELDLERVLHRRSLDELAESVVVWTVLGDRLLIALRRLAQENEATRRLARGNEAHAPAGSGE
jgi:DNA-binding transcriptional MerR regulator